MSGDDHLDDVGDLHHVEQRGDARHDVLAGRGRRRDERVVGAGQRHDQRRQRLGELVLVGGAVGEQHLLDARELRCRFGGRAWQFVPATSTCTGRRAPWRRRAPCAVASLR